MKRENENYLNNFYYYIWFYILLFINIKYYTLKKISNLTFINFLIYYYFKAH